MNEYVEILKRYMAENPPNYGSDANSILEMLFTYYHECNNTDHLSFTVTRNKYLTLLIYAYNADAFRRLESKKDAIEASFGHELDWYSSRESSVAKRIVYKCEMDIFNTDRQPDIFAWMVAAYDSLYAALETVGE